MFFIKTRAYYFINNKLLGEAEINSNFLPHSLAYCCPTCGEVWARITMQPHKQYWKFEPVPCEKHVVEGGLEYGRIPGCLLLERLNMKQNLSIMWWGRALEHLPPAVLQREFELTLSYYEKVYNDNEKEESSNPN